MQRLPGRPRSGSAQRRRGRRQRQLARQQQGPKPTYAAAVAGKIHNFVAKDANEICEGCNPYLASYKPYEAKPNALSGICPHVG